MTTPLGKRGLYNVGNTCYLNSALQGLRHTADFSKLFLTDKWRELCKEDSTFLEATASLIRSLWDYNTTPVHPQTFVREFLPLAEKQSELRFGHQADATEAIIVLLDEIHTRISREVRMQIKGEARNEQEAAMIRGINSWIRFFQKNYSPIVDMFYGQTQTSVRCAECRHTVDSYDPWSVLKASIPGAERAGAPAPNLMDCLDSAMASETPDDYTCEKCKKKGSILLQRRISRFPKYMILSLKRFTNSGAKVRARIPYNEDGVDLSEWAAWPELPNQKTNYRVYATIEHLGGSRGGHYTMRARSATGWLRYDDASVSPAANGLAEPDTYVLFLEQI